MNIFSDISLLWLIPLGLLCALISFFYYKNQFIESKKGVKASLISLRSFALFLLGLLLFGVIYEQKETKSEKPVFVTLIDNSSSMLNYQDSTGILNEIEDFKKQLEFKYPDKFDFRTYSLGQGISLDSIDLKDEISNHEVGFDFLYNEFYNRNVGGICFISDGNFNQGSNPIYSAKKIDLTPIFTLGVGDTLIKKDQLIRNVNTNEIAFYKNDFPIEIQIEAQKMNDVTSELSLWQDDKLIDSQALIYGDQDSEFKTVVFNVNASSIGFQNYTVRLKNEDKESSYENNRRSVFVEVIDSRSKVLMIAKAPHPDLTAIKQVLDKDQNIDVESVLLSEWDGTIKDVSLVIWHNPSENGKALQQLIIKENKPCLYMLGLNAKESFVNDLNLGIRLPRVNSIDQVQGAIQDGFQLFDISDKLKRAIKNWQPLSVPFGDLNHNGGSVLIKQKVGSILKESPVLFFNSSNGKKSGVIIGEGLWRWRLSNYMSSNNVNAFNELIQKTTQYLTVKTNTDPLRISLPKRINSNRSMIINAEFYNSSFERIITPEINFILTNNKDVSTDYTFSKKQFDYALDLGELNEGVYSWSAEVFFNGKRHSKKGSFVVEDISIEDIATRADHNLLNQISSNSNGNFYKLEDYNSLINEISLRRDIATVSYQESTFLDLIDWKIILLLIVLLLAIEWFIRRYSGTY